MGEGYKSLETEYITRIIRLRKKLKDLNVIKESTKIHFLNLNKNVEYNEYRDEYTEIFANDLIPTLERTSIAYSTEISSLEKELNNLNNPEIKNELSVEEIKEKLIKREEEFEKENSIEAINSTLNKIKKPKALGIFEMLEDASLDNNDDLV